MLVGGATLSKLSRGEKARLRRRSIGYVFQDFNLLPGLTAVENVSLPLELDGLTARKARAIGMQALDELELTERAETFPGRAFRRRAAAGGDRPRGGGRPPAAARRRAVGRARLGERGDGDAHAGRRLPPGRGHGGRHPRRAARLVGGPGGVHQGRPHRRPDHAAAEPRVAAAVGPAANDRRAGPADRDRRRRASPARGDALGAAAVPPRVAAAAAGADADHGRGRRDDLRRRGRHEHPAACQRRVRVRQHAGQPAGKRPASRQPDRGAQGAFRHPRRDREPGLRDRPGYRRPAPRPESGRRLRPARCWPW